MFCSDCRKSGILPLFRVLLVCCLSHSLPGGKPAKYKNLWVFIRIDAHAVKAGINLRGCGPLITPVFFDKLADL